jgi:sortase (surface protein transpeptidase)
VEKVRPEDTSALQHADKPWLTLLTCQSYDPASDAYLWRIVVRAVLSEIR